jgi:hypothetical protein
VPEYLYDIGQEVIVTSNKSNHGFEISSVVKIMSRTKSGGNWYNCKINRNGYHVKESDLVPLNGQLTDEQFEIYVRGGRW